MAIMLPFAPAALFSRPYVLEGSFAELLVDMLGFFLFLAGAMFRFWATMYIGGRKGEGLMMVGPYSICRNPLYLGTFLMLSALVVWMQNFTFAAGATLATWVYLRVTIGSEEHRLYHHFGGAYREYCQRVPRFWPSFRRYHSPREIVVNVVGLQRELFNAYRWMLIPIAGELLSYTRSSGLLPPFFHFP